jgi:YHS domain-containing protein
MKKITLYIAASVFFTACNNNENTSSATFNTADTAVKTEEAKPLASNTKIDPICEMEYDASWTEYSVYNGDTVKFCSEVCKEVFDKNPDKYAAKLK